MTRTVSFTPPDRTGCPAGAPAVRRRRVLYIPGYDPDAEARSRMLFVREVLRYAKRFGFTEKTIGRSEPLPGLLGFRWRVAAGTPDWSTETSVEVLRWDDIVARDFRRPLPVAVLILVVALLYSVATGGFFRLFRLSPIFGGVILYPPVMVALALGLSGAAGWAAMRLVGLAGEPPGGIAAGVAVVTAVASLAALYPLGRRWYVWHLMFDWLFNWQHGCGLRPDYEERVGRFAAHLATAMAEGDADEILVVGHSSGAPMAIEVVGEALAVAPFLAGPGRPTLSLLTLGSCMPLVGVNVLARTCRERIARIVEADAVTWVEYQAPQDWLNFAGFNPLRDLPALRKTAKQANPIIRSSKFKEIIAPATYSAILYRPFRMHFQFLMANDFAGEYDYVAMLVGPRTLCERVLGEADAAGGSGPEINADEIAAAERDRADYELRDAGRGADASAT